MTEKLYIVNDSMIATKIVNGLNNKPCWMSCESLHKFYIKDTDVAYEYIPENFVIKKALKKLK